MAAMNEETAVKVIVAGTRTFNNFALLTRKLNKLVGGIKRPVIIVSGTAEGADRLGEQWAYTQPLQRVIGVKRFHPDWEKYGKSAGPRRNAKMVKYADRAVFFYDGKSPGTKNCIQLAREAGLKIKVIYYGTQRPNHPQVGKRRSDSAAGTGPRLQKNRKRNLSHTKMER